MVTPRPGPVGTFIIPSTLVSGDVSEVTGSDDRGP